MLNAEGRLARLDHERDRVIGLPLLRRKRLGPKNRLQWLLFKGDPLKIDFRQIMPCFSRPFKSSFTPQSSSFLSLTTNDHLSSSHSYFLHARYQIYNPLLARSPTCRKQAEKNFPSLQSNPGTNLPLSSHWSRNNPLHLFSMVFSPTLSTT